MQGEVGQGQDLSASFYFSFSLVDVEFWNIRSFAPVASQWIPFLLRLAIGSRCQHWHQIGTTAADNKNLQEQNFRKQQCNIVVSSEQHSQINLGPLHLDLHQNHWIPTNITGFPKVRNFHFERDSQPQQACLQEGGKSEIRLASSNL